MLTNQQCPLFTWKLKQTYFVNIITDMYWSYLILTILYGRYKTNKSMGTKIIILFQKSFHIIIYIWLQRAAIANEWRLDLCNQEKSSFLTTYYVLYLLGLQYSQNFKIQKADPEMIATRYCCNTAGVKFVFSKKATKFDKTFTDHLTDTT